MGLHHHFNSCVISSLFAVISAAAIANETTGTASYVWLEGEKPTAVNVEPKRSGWGNARFLSEENWLSLSIKADRVERDVPADGVVLKYAFVIQDEGTYELWSRIGFEFVRSTFQWRVDASDWETVGPEKLTTDLMKISEWCEVAWLRLGKMRLDKGSHALEIRLPKTKNRQGKTNRILFALDAICLQRGEFSPNSRLKPGNNGRDQRDRQAANVVYQVPEPKSPAARAEIALEGLWEVCRHDEQHPGETAAPIKNFPKYPHWRTIAVPGNKNKLRPDLLFAHRLWYRTRVHVPRSCEGRSFFIQFPQNNLNTLINACFHNSHSRRVQIMVSMLRWSQLAILLVIGVLQEADASAQSLTLKTSDDPRMEFSSNGALRGLSAAGKELMPRDRGGFVPVSICDVTRGTKFSPASGTMHKAEGGTLALKAELPDLALDVSTRYKTVGRRVDVTLQVHGGTTEDRGLLVRFALPIDAKGWRWWDDLEGTRVIGTSGTFENTRGIREFASLPEWRDKPTLNMGTHSTNFCSVMTGPVGICFAVPLDQPRVFRTGYDAERGLFYIVYDVALVPETRPAGTAEFTFHIYQCDPSWGMRSALDRYYHLFPGFFKKHVERQGMWMAFSKLSDIDNVNEFRFAFQEGAPEPGYDDRLGVQSLTYFTHAGMFANIPDYDPRAGTIWIDRVSITPAEQPAHEYVVDPSMKQRYERRTADVFATSSRNCGPLYRG